MVITEEEAASRTGITTKSGVRDISTTWQEVTSQDMGDHYITDIIIMGNITIWAICMAVCSAVIRAIIQELMGHMDQVMEHMAITDIITIIIIMSLGTHEIHVSNSDHLMRNSVSSSRFKPLK